MDSVNRQLWNLSRSRNVEQLRNLEGGNKNIQYALKPIEPGQVLEWSPEAGGGIKLLYSSPFRFVKEIPRSTQAKIPKIEVLTASGARAHIRADCFFDSHGQSIIQATIRETQVEPNSSE